MGTDLALVIENGEVVERGPPKQLLEKKGKLCALLKDQMRPNLEMARNPSRPQPSYGSQRKNKSHGGHTVEKSDASGRSFRPNAPEFVPSYQRGTEANTGQPSHEHPDLLDHAHSHVSPSSPTRRSSIKRVKRQVTPQADSQDIATDSNKRPLSPAAGPKYDGAVEVHVGVKKTPRLNRWHRRRQAKSDTPSNAESSHPDTKLGAGAESIPEQIRNLRHVSGPGHFPSGSMSNSRIDSKDDQQHPRARRQRHLRIRKHRENPASRSNATLPDSYDPASPMGNSSSNVSAVTTNFSSNPIVSEDSKEQI